MEHIIRLLTFYLGAIVGSFLNVCIYRLPRGESVISPPSRCPRCKKPIRPYDNIPILSYILLRGCCRDCGETISPRYLAVELLSALTFLGVYTAYRGLLPVAVIYIVFLCSLIVVFFIDLEHQIIPDQISIGGTAFGLLASISYPILHGTTSRLHALYMSIIGAACGMALFWLIRFVGTRVFRKEAMGLGDVKLMGYIGSVLGWQMVLFTTVSAAFVGSAAGIFLIIIGRARLGSRLPFGPFLCVGAVLALLRGVAFINWYLSLL